MRSALDPGYGRNFYLDQREISAVSAAAVVPLLVEAVCPTSVIDVGCGAGTWLAAFERCGVRDVTGVDGADPPREMLQVAAERISKADLERPMRFHRSFDLAVCLEVAEHLPKAHAAGFVSDLTSCAPVVAFSGAIPGQGGTGHVNEQWQSYWADRFAVVGYRSCIALRSRMWHDERIAAYYAQNLVIYVNDALLSEYPKLRSDGCETLDVVHPRLWTRRTEHPILSAVGVRLPAGVKNALTQRVRSRSRYLRQV